MREHENSGSTLHARLRRVALNTVSADARAARMRHFETTIAPKPGARIIDLGGSPRLWRHVQTPLHITILNLAVQPIGKEIPTQHDVEIVRGDATETAFDSNAFDIVFSNSVIEHVGDATKRRAFAKEVRRLASCYYVQTPCKSFPLEAHTIFPFWWYYPRSVQTRLLDRWRKSRPAYAEFIAHTTAVTEWELRELFPDAEWYVERLAGFAKSNTVFRRG